MNDSELLEKIFTNMQFMIALLDTRFNFIRVNQAYADAGGYPPEFFVGKNHFELYPHAENEAIFRRVVETGKPYTVFAKPFEYPDHPERGVTYWDWSLIPVRGERGEPAALVLTLVDVTRRVRAEAKLRESERAAIRQERMAALGRVAAGVVHEIRNPLSGLNIYLEAAESILERTASPGPQDAADLRRALRAARSVSEKIERVIRRVMDFAKPSPTVLGPAQLNDAVAEAVALAAVTLRARGVRIETKPAGDLPLCNADPRLIEQVLLNLITNAAEAMEGQPGEKRIEIVTEAEGDTVTIIVSDSGPGVPESLRERIFEPFFTTREGGTGLGLAVSARIVSDHGGTIDVGAGPQGGALFRIRIPRGAEALSRSVI